jgi:hypothetical protein
MASPSGKLTCLRTVKSRKCVPGLLPAFQERKPWQGKGFKQRSGQDTASGRCETPEVGVQFEKGREPETLGGTSRDIESESTGTKSLAIG